MPKRIGYLYEKLVSTENCIKAEKLMSKNKPKNQMAKQIGANAEEYGRQLSELLKNDGWVPSKSREFDIVDSYKGKTRHLKVPCLLDQSVQYSWMNVATPYIEKRNYFYIAVYTRCGRIGRQRHCRNARKQEKV
jgi:hypothetical protein